MADNTQLPNGFTGFAFRKPAGGTSAADAIREREAQRAAHAGQPVNERILYGKRYDGERVDVDKMRRQRSVSGILRK